MSATILIPLAIGVNLIVNISFLVYEVIKAVGLWLA
jgi:hypothetical protein